MPTCPSCGIANRDGARFCDSCGAPLVEAAPAHEVRKTVTVFFRDVSGSTALGERIDPESRRLVMARYFETASAVLERHGGTVEFIGDAVMAVFGVPVVREDDALRPLRTSGTTGCWSSSPWGRCRTPRRCAQSNCSAPRSPRPYAPR